MIIITSIITIIKIIRWVWPFFLKQVIICFLLRENTFFKESCGSTGCWGGTLWQRFSKYRKTPSTSLRFSHSASLWWQGAGVRGRLKRGRKWGVVAAVALRRWAVSAPHTGVLTCTVGKQRKVALRGGGGCPDRRLLEDLALLFVLLIQSPAADGGADKWLVQTQKQRVALGQMFCCAGRWADHKVAATCQCLVQRLQSKSSGPPTV